MRSLSLFFVGVLLVSAVPAGAAVDTVADGTAPAPALSDAASDELVVETVFSLEGTDADEVRVIREYHVGSDVQELSESIYYPIEDVSTRNMRRQGGIFEWDGSGDVARIEYVAQAEDVGSQVGATRGDGYAVVSTTYDHIRTDADRLTTEVSVDGEGTAGEQFAVLGGYTEYSRDTPTGEYRVVVPDHVDFRGNATEMLDQIEYTDTQLGARAGRDGEATYFVVDLDLGIVSGRAFESSATGNTAGDVLLDNTGPTTTTHEAVHSRHRPTGPTARRTGPSRGVRHTTSPCCCCRTAFTRSRSSSGRPRRATSTRTRDCQSRTAGPTGKRRTPWARTSSHTSTARSGL